MSVDEAKAWEKRLEDMRRDIDKKQKDLDLSKDVLATQKLLLGDVATALAALVGQLTGEVPALQLGSKNRVRPEDVDKKLEELGKSGVSDATVQSLAADRSALDGAMRKLAERTSREKRMPELKATIVEMEPKDAAALLGTAIKPEAAAELLLALTAEERASILAAMVKQNPATAGELFTRLGAVDVKSDKNAGTESAPQSALDAAKGKKG
jgi:flagellar motility protein MotE (MotC chaperone)